MELKPRERKELDVQYLDEETGVHVKVQEVVPRTSHENKSVWYSINVHVENDIYWNAFDLACLTEQEARDVAEKSFEFFKSIKPSLAIKIKEHKGDHDHSCC